MRILMISTDRALCNTQSAVYRRTLAYAREAGAIDVIVFATRAHACSGNECDELRVTPTQSRSRFLYMFDALRIIRRLPRPDVVTTQDPLETGIAGFLAARPQGAPLHVQIHTDIFDPKYRTYSLVNRIRTLIALFILRRAARVRVVSGGIKRSLERLDLDVPVSILPIFVDVERFGAIIRKPYTGTSIKLLYAGRFEREKRPGLAVTVLADVRRASINARLTMIGDGRLMPAVRSLARSLGVSEYVEFGGWQRDIAPYLAQTDVVIVPSEYEGYGMIIIEALAAHVPVVACDVGVAREAGAYIADERGLSAGVLDWIARGERAGHLRSYPYASFDEYVRAYVEDIRACVVSQKVVG